MQIHYVKNHKKFPMQNFMTKWWTYGSFRKIRWETFKHINVSFNLILILSITLFPAELGKTQCSKIEFTNKNMILTTAKLNQEKPQVFSHGKVSQGSFNDLTTRLSCVLFSSQKLVYVFKAKVCSFSASFSLCSHIPVENSISLKFFTSVVNELASSWMNH